MQTFPRYFKRRTFYGLFVVMTSYLVSGHAEDRFVSQGRPNEYVPVSETQAAEQVALLQSLPGDVSERSSQLKRAAAQTHGAVIDHRKGIHAVPLPAPRPPLAGIPIRRPAPTATPISSCNQPISSPGQYVLTADLTSQPSCLSIHDTHDISLDCAGHRIDSQALAGTMQVDHVSNLQLSHCVIQNTAPGSLLNSLYVRNSQSFTVTDSTLGAVNVISLDGGSFQGNHIQGFYNQIQSSHITLAGNTIEGPKDRNVGAVVSLSGGVSNTLRGNHIDGGWTFQMGPDGGWLGTDNGLHLENEIQDEISGNKIENTWGAGIESRGYLLSATIANNSFHNGGNTAIGGWTNTSWSGNVISGNKADYVQSFFYADVAIDPNVASPTFFYFQNNRLTNNDLSFVRPIDGQGHYEAGITIDVAKPRVAPPGAMITIQAANNELSGNNLGQQSGFLLTPPEAFHDGGGNVCAPSTMTSPIHCSLST